MPMTSTENVTLEIRQIANQANALAIGLQHAAPPGASLQSVQYLLETATQLEQACDEIEKLSQNNLT